ncbi:MAG: TRAP transporter small permease [Acidobacteriota bacterium]
MSWIDRLDRILGHLLAALLALAVLAVLWQVVSRYALGDPSSFTDELVRYVMVWLGLLGGAYALGRRLHLAIDLLPSRLEAAARRRLDAAVYGLIALFALAVMVYGGGRLVVLTLALGQRSAALGLPLGYVYTVVPLSGLIISIYAVASIAGAGPRAVALGGADGPGSEAVGGAG